MNRWLTWTFVALMGVPAAAQEQPAPAGEAEPVPAAAAPAAPAPAAPANPGLGQADLRFDTETTLSPQQMVEDSQAALEGMRAGLARALEVLTKARESKDVIRLNCVNEKLTPMKGILKIAEDALISLQENVATGNVEAARYEYSKIRISKEKINTLLVQAINCVGAESTYTGDTEITTDVDPDMVGDDPYYGDPQILVDPANNTVEPDPTETDVGEDTPPIDRPPPASPYR